MKKYLFLLIVLVLCGCGPATINNKTEQGILKEFDRITHFTYKEHKYIRFEISPMMNNGRMGIVHDPNCPCHGK